MTPTALTPAARESRPQPPRSAPRTSSARSAAPHSPLRRPTAPRAPRRVSGPMGGVAAPEPRRRTGARTTTVRAPLALHVLAYVRALPDHPLLDRIVRGRAWIPLLGVLLAGIVAMQVEVLKLNAGIGQSLERTTVLQSQNELLRANVARLADGQRIESRAAQLGMMMAAPGQVRYLAAGGSGNVAQAAANVQPPSSPGFASQVAGIASAAGATAGASTAGTPPVTAGASTTGTGPATGGASTGGAATATGGAAATPGTSATP